MTFTYTPESPDDITRVRFHIGDTDSEAAIFTDEELSFIISEAGSWQAAVVSCIKSVIARVSKEPDFKADWLQVDSSRALAGWTSLLAEKRQEFGIPAVSSSGKAVYRSDSLQEGPPDGW